MRNRRGRQIHHERQQQQQQKKTKQNHTDTETQTHTHTHRQTHNYTYTHAHTQTQTHTHTITHTHTDAHTLLCGCVRVTVLGTITEELAKNGKVKEQGANRAQEPRQVINDKIAFHTLREASSKQGGAGEGKRYERHDKTGVFREQKGIERHGQAKHSKRMPHARTTRERERESARGGTVTLAHARAVRDTHRHMHTPASEHRTRM